MADAAGQGSVTDALAGLIVGMIIYVAVFILVASGLANAKDDYVILLYPLGSVAGAWAAGYEFARIAGRRPRAFLIALAVMECLFVWITLILANYWPPNPSVLNLACLVAAAYCTYRRAAFAANSKSAGKGQGASDIM
jgi:peptidoglycan/LPS O-acetylase OafA/YrhL